MPPAIRVGVTATKAMWGPAFRSFVRDHASGVTVETLMSAAQLPGPAQHALDVLIIDDQMPLLRAGHVGAARDRGTHVIGLWDETFGRGRDHVIDLGVDEPLPASTPPAELLQSVLRVGPVNSGSSPFADEFGHPTHNRPHTAAPPTAAARPRTTQRRGRATTTYISSVSGGAGATEALIAVAERLGTHAKVLIVEAGGSTLAQRLRRAPEYGLAWCLERLGAGHRAFPGALSPCRDDGVRPLGRADVICGTAAPAGPPPVNATLLGHLLDEAATEYDHVLIEAGPLLTPAPVPGADRFAVARTVLSRADQAIVFASSDPCGATKLIEWRSVLHRDLDLAVPCIAVFGRTPKRRFERAALVDVLARNTGGAGFIAVRFLPEDSSVARARWDGMLVNNGRWAHAVNMLADDLRRHHPAGPVLQGASDAPAGRALQNHARPVRGRS